MTVSTIVGTHTILLSLWVLSSVWVLSLIQTSLRPTEERNQNTGLEQHEDEFK